MFPPKAEPEEMSEGLHLAGSNFCSSEYAGCVSVTIGSHRRRIAERFRCVKTP
jgi:hypothetical protein